MPPAFSLCILLLYSNGKWVTKCARWAHPIFQTLLTYRKSWHKSGMECWILHITIFSHILRDLSHSLSLSSSSHYMISDISQTLILLRLYGDGFRARWSPGEQFVPLSRQLSITQVCSITVTISFIIGVCGPITSTFTQ